MVEEGSGDPVVGAFVGIYDATGARVAAGLTGANGDFVLRPPEPGTYRLGAARIGYRSAATDPIRVGDGEIASMVIEVPGDAIEIEGIHVEMSGRCTLRPEEGEATWALWSEARKALEITEWTAERDHVQSDVVLFERVIRSREMVVDTESVRVVRVTGDQPFISDPPDSLAALGYVRRRGSRFQYHGLDATALLSDVFLDTHCFRRVPGGSALAGLSFEPIEADAGNEIRGVLWLDRATAELRLLEFAYVRPPIPVFVEPTSYGGSVEFTRLPDGSWVVGHWKIRSPLFQRERRRMRHVGYSETEGDILALHEQGGSRLPWDRTAARLRGVVRYGGAIGLPDVEVRLVGTPYRVRTDKHGRFDIEGLPGGTYRIEAADAALPRGRVRRLVELSRGATTSVELDG